MAAAVVVPGLLLFGLQWYFLNRFESATSLVLKQASHDVALAFCQQIQRDFKSPTFNLLEQVPHDAVRELQWDRVSRALDSKKGAFKFIDRFFMWSRPKPGQLAPAEFNDTVVFYAMHDRTAADELSTSKPNAYHFFTDEVLSPRVLSKAAALATNRSNFAFARIATETGEYFVVFHFMYDVHDRSQWGGVLGFTVDMQDLRQHYFRDAISAAALQARRLPGFPVPTAMILDDAGHLVYASSGASPTEYDGEATFPLLFFDIDLVESLSPLRLKIQYWTVRTGYSGTTVATIIERQTNQQRTLWWFLMLITLAGAVLAVRAAAQQVRLVQLKSEFVSSVSHDLKTPLAKIQLFIETLSSGRVRSPEKTQEYYDVIRAQTERLG
ncbi:MAG TPA: histidine kinase dimerization/phospho-acceptor domain-containing protein, partial [Vicinamibacterales bacterium]|nr:histidine kinase dimerization/phospho-acceptor domain-containing protein [Vicinamibacterales bacterium]